MTSDFFINIFSEVIIVFKCMFLIFRPALDVVKEGRISKNQTFTRPIVGVFLVGGSLGPLKIKKLQPQNCNFFFGASPDADCKSSQVRMLTDSVSIWCQNLSEN